MGCRVTQGDAAGLIVSRVGCGSAGGWRLMLRRTIYRECDSLPGVREGQPVAPRPERRPTMLRSPFDDSGLLHLLPARPLTGETGILDLSEIADFGADPGNLRMLVLVPEGLPEGAPLAVVLHGCGQTAAGYAAGAGWMELARRHGFALLLPEQRRANNPGLCFDWFQPGDTARGAGEVASIRSMVEYALATWRLDRHRVFVTGLSAGGAMSSALLATYPDLFAGGAIIAGLPYGGAATVPEAFDMMREGRARPAREWGDKVRAASAHRGPWPRVSVWQGGADRTVHPVNAAAIVGQWLDVHGLAATPSAEDNVDGAIAPGLARPSRPGLRRGLHDCRNGSRDTDRAACARPRAALRQRGPVPAGCRHFVQLPDCRVPGACCAPAAPPAWSGRPSGPPHAWSRRSSGPPIPARSSARHCAPRVWCAARRSARHRRRQTSVADTA